MIHLLRLAAALALTPVLATGSAGVETSAAHEPAAPNPPAKELPPQGVVDLVKFDGDRYEVTIDTTRAPELTDWARRTIIPMVKEWYPKMVKLLPSEGYRAPARFRIVFDPEMRGVAATGGTEIRCAAGWMSQNRRGEAPGAIFHEMVHVVQQYGWGRRRGNPGPPGWLTEGITDYLRWYIYEPQSRGAEISRGGLARASYDGSYRVTANFLNWVTAKHGAEFVPKLNALIREGKYREESWKDLTGRPVQELGAEWKADLERKINAEEAGRRVLDHLGRIVIPVIEFDKVTVEEAFDFLRQRLVELDPDPDPAKRGISVLIKLHRQAATAKPAAVATTVSYSAKQVPVPAALAEIARQARLDVHLTEVGIVICQPGDPPFPNDKADKGEVWKTLYQVR